MGFFPSPPSVPRKPGAQVFGTVTTARGFLREVESPPPSRADVAASLSHDIALNPGETLTCVRFWHASGGGCIGAIGSLSVRALRSPPGGMLAALRLAPGEWGGGRGRGPHVRQASPAAAELLLAIYFSAARSDPREPGFAALAVPVLHTCRHSPAHT